MTALPRKAIMALLRDKHNMMMCEAEATSYTTCLAMSEYSMVKCMPYKRSLDHCVLFHPHHDRNEFKMRRSSFVSDMIRTSRNLKIKH